MPLMLVLLYVPAAVVFGILGFVGAPVEPAGILRLSRLAITFLLVATALVGICGFAPRAVVHTPSGVSPHGVAAQLLFMVTWVTTPPVIAVSVRVARSSGRLRWLLLVPLVLGAVASLLLASFTGYLGPSRATGRASIIRFWVLHVCLFSPGTLLALGGAAFLFYTWRPSRVAA